MISKQLIRGAVRYGPAALRLGARAYKAYNKGRAYKNPTVVSEANRKGNTITTTDQAITQYKKKKPSRRTKKARKRAYKNFVKQALKLVGSNTAVLNFQSGNYVGGLPADQTVNTVTLGGKSWATNYAQASGNDDMRKVMGADDRLTKIVNNTKFLITSSRCDITYRNSGSNAAEVDMYTISHYGDKHMSSYIDEITKAETRTPLPPQSGAASGTDPFITTRGMTPFDFPLLSKMGNSITEKKKFIVPAGGTITHSFTSRKNVWFDAQEITGSSPTNADHYVKSGYTKSVLFITKPVVGVANASVNCIIGATSVYKYKIFSDNRDFNVYNPA